MHYCCKQKLAYSSPPKNAFYYKVIIRACQCTVHLHSQINKLANSPESHRKKTRQSNRYRSRLITLTLSTRCIWVTSKKLPKNTTHPHHHTCHFRLLRTKTTINPPRDEAICILACCAQRKLTHKLACKPVCQI